MHRLLSLRHLSKKYATDVSHSVFPSPSSYQTTTSIIKQAHTFRSSLGGTAPHSFSFMVPRKFSSHNYALSNVRFIDWSFWLPLTRFGRGLSRFYRRFPSLGRSRSWRSPLWMTSENVVYGLIAVNLAVFTLWTIGDEVFMARHFLITFGNIQHGGLHTMVTSAFSHIDFGHLFPNMLGLYVFGKSLGRSFGPEFLLKLYLAGAVGGFVLYLIHIALMSSNAKVPLSQFWMAPGLGADGAVTAIMFLDVFYHGRLIFFDYQLQILLSGMGIFLIGCDVLRYITYNPRGVLERKEDPQVAWLPYLGGGMVGALAWMRIKSGRF